MVRAVLQGRRARLAAGAAGVVLAATAAGAATLASGPPSPAEPTSPPLRAADASTDSPAVEPADPADAPTLPADRSTRAAAAAAHPGLAGYRAPRATQAVALPVRLLIPSLGVDTPLDGLGQAPDRTVEVPSDPMRAGWYEQGPRPGQVGPAVLLGHVDGQGRPGIFFRVDELRAGDAVTVARADGSSVLFRVTRTERMPKTAFPTAAVYLPTAGPELRLVTCGGSFDTATGHYRDNVIAYAELAA